MQYKTLIVDGPYLAHRSYASPYRLTTSDHLDATMIHGFIRALNARRKEFKPNKIIVAWESHGTPSWRRELVSTYKPGKQLNPQFISSQEDLKILLHLLNVPQYYSPTNEADDVIARLIFDKSTEFPILIYTPDKDIMQTIGDAVHTYNGKQIFTDKDVKEKFGVWPEDIPKFLAIVGDDSDNIIGVKGYGPKKTADMINNNNYSQIKNEMNKVEMNKKLTKLNYGCELKKLEIKTEHTIDSLLNKYRLKSIQAKIEEYKKIGQKREPKLKGDWI